MNDLEVLQEIKREISTIKKSLREQNTLVISSQYSALKEKLMCMEKASKSDFFSNLYSPKAIREILHKSFTARKGTTNCSNIASCIADADSYIDYYIEKINND
jgi:hypothetical protein